LVVHFGIMTRDTRTRMLETAADLVQDRGYHGLALAELLTLSNAPRGSLYFHFPDGKDQLIATTTRDGVEAVTASLRATLAAEKSPGRAIRKILEAAATALEASDFRFGSPTAPLVLDGLQAGSEIVTLTSEAYAGWVGLFETSLAAAGVPARKAQSLALIVEASFEGLLIICRAHRDATPMRTGARELEEIVDAAASSPAKGKGKKS
jgi:TetR/AcrR family transcriptional repressor of lmrAB and yxaGH operons